MDANIRLLTCNLLTNVLKNRGIPMIWVGALFEIINIKKTLKKLKNMPLFDVLLVFGRCVADNDYDVVEPIFSGLPKASHGALNKITIHVSDITGHMYYNHRLIQGLTWADVTRKGLMYKNKGRYELCITSDVAMEQITYIDGKRVVYKSWVRPTPVIVIDGHSINNVRFWFTLI
jgi:hypothetical protein